MLFQVRMDVNIPLDMPVEKANEIKAVEKAYSQDLQRQGKWRHICALLVNIQISVFLMLKAMKSYTTFYKGCPFTRI